MSDKLPVIYRHRGRPTYPYSDEKAAEICLRLAEGESLKSICRDDHMPSHGTVLKWVFNDESGFYNRYARARRLQAELRADELIEICDNPKIGVVRTDGPRGTEIRQGDMIEHRKLQVDVRKWIAARLLPKKYGVQVENTSAAEEKSTVIVSGGLPD